MKTPVIFRKFKDGGPVVAIFPAQAGDLDPTTTCGSYQTIGQQGEIGTLSAIALDYRKFTHMARFAEYTPLKEELERMGYDLKVVGRRSPAHDRVRYKECGMRI